MSEAASGLREPSLDRGKALNAIYQYLPELGLLVVAAVWGSSYAVAKHITLQVTVLHYLVLRFGLTAIVLTPALRPLLVGDRLGSSLVVGCVLGGLLLGIFLCETWGITLTTATNAAFLISLCVALTPLVEWIVLSNKPSSRIFIAAALCMTGAWLMSPNALSDPLSNIGDWLMLLAALLRAVMVTMTKKLTQRTYIPSITLTAIQAWVVFIGISAIMLISKNGMDVEFFPSSMEFWICLIFLVLFCTVLAFFVQNYASARTSPSRVGFLMGSEPVFGALFAWAIVGESIHGAAFCGAALVVIATAAVARDS